MFETYFNHIFNFARSIYDEGTKEAKSLACQYQVQVQSDDGTIKIIPDHEKIADLPPEVQALIFAQATILNLRTVELSAQRETYNKTCLESAFLAFSQLLQITSLHIEKSESEKSGIVKIASLNSIQLQNLLKAPQDGHNKRYQPQRNRYSEAQKEAERLWLDGDTRKHHEMAEYFLDDYYYSDMESSYDKVGLSKATMRKKMIEVLKKLGRDDLIHGVSK